MPSAPSPSRHLAGGLFFLLGFISSYLLQLAGTPEKTAVSFLIVCQGAALTLLTRRWLFWSVITIIIFFLGNRFPFLVRNADAFAIYTAGLIIPLRLFLRSLMPGQEPLVSALARQAHGGAPLRSDVAFYTRYQTWFWVIFLGFLLILPLPLAFWVSFRAWIWLVRGGVLGLIFVVLVAEYGIRRLAIRNFDHVSPWTAARAWKQQSTIRR
ncbi:Hypothetical protein GOX1391 [Gluconobacter oxydans 621H]|uniref:Intracellular septation protein A n=1 Tax=Gluconobacter oxydans (strain 621H) TaxID=290633 RepID=Q5FR53_GLUOX|nr:Hypothetical protein GOX1391 [Gluconobacter oxydans 621H]KXV34894.1 hypothetical protein AD939_02120 [Gluconobacter oxydans]TCW21828.1 hypothetical protein EDC20_1403 [Gluconobacter oxydans]